MKILAIMLSVGAILSSVRTGFKPEALMVAGVLCLAAFVPWDRMFGGKRFGDR